MNNCWPQVSKKVWNNDKEFLKDDEIMCIPLLEILEQLLNVDFVLCTTL